MHRAQARPSCHPPREYAQLSTREDWQKEFFRLGVKEVLTCDPKAAADPGFDESA